MDNAKGSVKWPVRWEVSVEERIQGGERGLSKLLQ